jgi:hypothetical protein
LVEIVKVFFSANARQSRASISFFTEQSDYPEV